MSPTVRTRKVQLSIKLPPDIERKVRDAVDAGKYTNITDAVTGMLRAYFRYENLNLLCEKVDELKAEVDALKKRNERLEKIIGQSWCSCEEKEEPK